MQVELIENDIQMPIKSYTNKVRSMWSRSVRLYSLNLRFSTIKFPAYLRQWLTLWLLFWSAYSGRKAGRISFQIGSLAESGSFERGQLEIVHESCTGVAGRELGCLLRSKCVSMLEVYNWADTDIGSCQNNYSRFHIGWEEAIWLWNIAEDKGQNLPFWPVVWVSSQTTISLS